MLNKALPVYRERAFIVVGGLSLIASLVLLGSVTSAQNGEPPRDYRGKCGDAGCHAEYAERSVVHGPVAQEACDGCHEPVEGKVHRFTFVEKGADLCFECHDEHEGRVTHKPVANGQCERCHDPHGSKTRGLLTADSLNELCLECHDELLEEMSFLHGPVAVGACTVCHDAHSSDHDHLLSSGDRDLCVRCHTGLSSRITAKSVVHAPVKEGCVSCHNPHGADNKMMLPSVAPDLCVDCHDDIGDTMDDAVVTHDALTSGKSCVGCHDPHASDRERLLVKPPMDLCLSCHDRELTNGEGTIKNVASLLRDNPSHHGPITQKNCSGCHQVHGGENYRLLIEPYPAGFYAPFEKERYALCFECHEPDLVEEEETDTLTNFRNGERNLHFVHVNRSPKGRTCRACHDVHASKLPKHITESVPFGEWKLPVNFVQTNTGGGCQPGCHRPYRYDRHTPIVNLPDS